MNLRKKMTGAAAVSVLLACSAALTGCNSDVHVKVSDYNFDTAGNMFAYAEFELSGEPLAESLGVDLDVLDAGKIDQPTAFDYKAGIESYEYSEEAMYEVVEKSGLGLHLVNGPATTLEAQAAGIANNELLASRFQHMADSVGQPAEDIQQNMYPTFIEYASGDPHYNQKVDTGKYADGEDGAYIPNYQVNFASLRWNRDKMKKQLVPAAYGATMLKQSLWAGDFLGNLHDAKSDEEVDASTAEEGPEADQGLKLGVSSVDGMQGMILTDEVWNKLLYVRDNLFYDPASKNIGGLVNTPDGYLPHAVDVEEAGDKDFETIKNLKVADGRSLLQDQWLMLWPTSEFFGMTDQRAANPNRNPAFARVFDGDPFPAAPAVNADGDESNDIASTDPYTVTRDVLLAVFDTIKNRHWNDKTGAFVTEAEGDKQGTQVDTFQAGYTIEALRMFERAIDGLPVGYANGEGAEGLKTEQGAAAKEMITKQADFILSALINKDGLAATGYDAAKGQADKDTSLQAQIGAIRGLTSAFLATEDEKYRDAARKLYAAMDEKLWDNDLKAYKTKGSDASYDAFTAGGVSAVFRLALEHLKNTSSDTDAPKALDQNAIQDRYVAFFRQVVNGPTLDEGMQASEFWDTGDVYKEGDDSGNTDGDTVPQIQKGHGDHGIAPILLPVKLSN
ncbi:hypothetical protein [Paenibacillus sacheonensis]|uniref:Uncharacterized protein n=1 Tax=Paenibacillus sacheonensis TaxID=742054 RepID=A0A7X5C1V8_9BACL|nr:hypothetical protein [Paenibacillus sacheonensis]MBM7567404.1 hypothetical protein [Paenibacillus sacheonensis]NBC69814.1 hypothetical protein [Paenibacillus sacheonensis]